MGEQQSKEAGVPETGTSSKPRRKSRLPWARNASPKSKSKSASLVNSKISSRANGATGGGDSLGGSQQTSAIGIEVVEAEEEDEHTALNTIGRTAGGGPTNSLQVPGQTDGSTCGELKNSTVIIREISPDPLMGQFLREVPLFAHLNRTEREKLGGALVEKSYLEGAVVFKEGDAGKYFYIIKEGKCTVTQTNAKGKQVILTQLSDGDHFGEQAILADCNRTATVTTDEYLILYVLTKAQFNALFKKDRLEVTFAQRRRVGISAEVISFGGAPPERSRARQALPAAAMSDATRQLVLNAVHGSLLFQTLEDEHKEAVAGVMYAEDIKPGQRIITEGEEGNRFYVIEQGSFEVFQRNENGVEVMVDQHTVGSSFGELALMYGAPRNASVVAVAHARVRVLERGLFNVILKEVSEAQLERYSRWLARVELLAPLTNFERIKIAEALEVVDYEAGSTIFQQGDLGDAMYIIVNGKVLVTCLQNDGTESTLTTLRVGDYFGERALMHNDHRAATVLCKNHCRLLKLKSHTFEQMLGPLEDVLKDKVASYDQPQASKWRRGSVQMEDLVVIGVLGKGSYGYVQLVQDGRKGDAAPTYALKAVSKQRIVDTHQKAHILDEKGLMMQMDHPFLVNLITTYSDKDCLYFVLEAALGGELFPILRKMRVFPAKQARFYAAQVILCFEYLHKKDFIYRDLKPENLLLDGQGYLKLTDFGFCKKVPHKTWTMCGTPEYLAPEVITHKGHGKAVDWWTIGIFIFEMLASYTPFYGRGDDLKMYDRICHGHVKFPSHFSKSVKTLIKGLLEARPHQRLGVGRAGAEAIKNSDWFARFDWQSLLWRKLPAPMPVNVADHKDLSHYSQNVKKLKIKPYVDDGTDWDLNF